MRTLLFVFHWKMPLKAEEGRRLKKVFEGKVEKDYPLFSAWTHWLIWESLWSRLIKMGCIEIYEELKGPAESFWKDGKYVNFISLEVSLELKIQESLLSFLFPHIFRGTSLFEVWTMRSLNYSRPHEVTSKHKDHYKDIKFEFSKTIKALDPQEGSKQDLSENRSMILKKKSANALVIRSHIWLFR